MGLTLEQFFSEQAGLIVQMSAERLRQNRTKSTQDIWHELYPQ
jgi:hypothetical protein